MLKNLGRQAVFYTDLVLSMSGFVTRHVSIPRIISFSFSAGFAFWLLYFTPASSSRALIYFIISEIGYIGFIMLVLSKNGLRLKFMRELGEENGYLSFEAILGILFFHNAASMGYISSATAGAFTVPLDKSLFFVVIFIPLACGFIIKILAAKAVTIDIYYWKDMFLGRKVTDFVESGPYKYFSNPMYGIGQVQAYAAAVWYGSAYGLAAAFLNQALIFTFFYLFEKKFIRRVYLTPEHVHA